jgi:hypothetical protein
MRTPCAEITVSGAGEVFIWVYGSQILERSEAIRSDMAGVSVKQLV